MPHEELWVETRGLRLAALAWGEPGLPVVLAVHGWLDNAASFEPLARHLAGRLRLVALELPGHGHSAHRPPGLPYHFVDFVQDVVDALDALGLEEVALLGHSLGASVAAFVAAAAPERVRRLALVEGLGPTSGRPREEPGRLRTAVAQMRRHDPERRPRHASLDEAAAARARAGGLSLQAARLLAARGTRRDRDGRVTWRSDPRLTFRSPIYLTEAQVRAFLRAIAAPTLLILGRDGLLAGRAATRARMACLRDLRLELLPGGHHLHMERPQAVAEVLLPFLAA
ncbi:alpha/beta fold hydrolase [Inmirania thermothiophila]|uniref:Pimeloyl-ACP methyl ester carboxylesterase n=1 Tax=Inmirania thermothiophila TaxID=1750597 RepID=A0A3N1Y0K6_9GAMM|nr:alpha/beta fold hydrolase [Inmirania thermothiophila]ROR32346.1 pimeloyl-ACP methyl ester carboxylesterase [Inmirania thermothiophila]